MVADLKTWREALGDTPRGDNDTERKSMANRNSEPDLVARLRRAIEESRLSLNQLDIASGVDRAQLSRFVRGERDLI